MLSVIIDVKDAAQRLPALLAQLTAGAVQGLVREVLIVAPHDLFVAELCEETGAERAESLAAAAERSRAERLLVARADFRLRDGWVDALTDHLSSGGGAARVRGLGGGLWPRDAVLVDRRRALAHPDLDRLRRQLGLRPRRVG